jgi:hypothetical protein
MANVLPLLSAATALVAVVIGPLIMIYVARKRAQLEAVVLVRVESIKQLRTLFSEFIAHLIGVQSAQLAATL